jgi:hypothetical protein
MDCGSGFGWGTAVYLLHCYDTILFVFVVFVELVGGLMLVVEVIKKLLSTTLEMGLIYKGSK